MRLTGVDRKIEVGLSDKSVWFYRKRVYSDYPVLTHPSECSNPIEIIAAENMGFTALLIFSV